MRNGSKERNGRKGFGKLRLGLSRSGIALVETSGWIRRKTEVLSAVELQEGQSVAAERLASGLSDFLADKKCAGRSATIVLADDLVRLFIVTPPQNASRLQDCLSATRMRFHTLYGDSPDDWQIEADYDTASPFLACGVPKALLGGIRKAAGEHKLSLAGIVPQFVASWNGWREKLEDAAWFGAVHDKTLTLGAIHHQRLCMIRTIPLPADGWTEKQWLAEHSAREALRLSLPAPQHIQLCGHLPVHWTTLDAGSMKYSRLGTMQLAPDGRAMPSSVALACSGLRA